MMITFKGSFTFSVAVALLACSAGLGAAGPAPPETEFSFKLDPASVEPGQRAVLEIRLPFSVLGVEDWDDESDSTPEAKDDLLTASRGFEVLERDYRRDGNTFVWRYQIAAYRAGSYLVPPVEIKAGPNTFSSIVSILSVKSTRGQGDIEVREGYGVLSPPWRWKLWLGILLAALAMGAAGTTLWRWLAVRLRRHAPPQPQAAASLPEEDPRDWLRREIQRIHTEREEGAPADQTLDRLTTAVREYFSRWLRLPAFAWTTPELHRRLAHDEEVRQVLPVLDQCDECRFLPWSYLAKDTVVIEGLAQVEKALLCGT